MLFILWFFILVALVNSLKFGSLDGYFTVDEAKILLGQLSTNNSNWIFEESGGFYRVTSGGTVKKNEILVLGGFSGGFPQGNFQVLYTIQRLLEDLENKEEVQELFKRFSIAFSVFPNEPAYEKSILISNSSDEFEVREIYGDQKNYYSNCNSNNDIGINPDMNFPNNFFERGDACFANFSGNSSSSSDITIKFMGKVTDYKAVINYQGSGNYYAGPHAGVSDASEIDSRKIFIDQVLKRADEEGFNIGSLYEINGEGLNGTCMDFVDSKNIPFIQISLGKYGKLTPEDDLQEDSEIHYRIFLDQIVTVLAEPKIKYLRAEEKAIECNYTCNQTSEVNISLIIKNMGTSDRKFKLDVSVEFENETNHLAESGIIEFINLADNNSVTYDSLNVKGTNQFTYSNRAINAGNEAIAILTFKKFVEEKNDRFNITYILSPLSEDDFRTNETTLYNIGFDENMGEENKSDGGSSDSFSNNEKIGLGIGLGLGIIVVILVILCVYKYKKKKSPGSNQI
jgi:hypothetical protein